MRLLPGAVGVLLLLVLLTWLLLRGTDTNAPAHAETLQALDDFALAEASLDRDLLQARAGLLRDYDALVKAVRAMEDAAAWLRSRAQAEGLDAGPADRLAATVAQREELTERFKSSNALLQNSRIGGGDPVSDARYITGRRQGAAGTDRPVCGAGAHGRTARRGSTGAARACPPAA